MPRRADSGDGQGNDLPSTLGFDDGAARVRNANARDSARLSSAAIAMLPTAADSGFPAEGTASAVAIDGGYMDGVGGTPLPPGRLESDVSLITDGLDRQESDP